MNPSSRSFDRTMHVINDCFMGNSLAHAAIFLICDFVSALIAGKEVSKGGSSGDDLVVLVKAYISDGELDGASGPDSLSVSYHKRWCRVFSDSKEVVESN